MRRILRDASSLINLLSSVALSPTWKSVPLLYIPPLLLPKSLCCKHGISLWYSWPPSQRCWPHIDHHSRVRTISPLPSSYVSLWTLHICLPLFSCSFSSCSNTFHSLVPIRRRHLNQALAPPSWALTVSETCTPLHITSLFYIPSPSRNERIYHKMWFEASKCFVWTFLNASLLRLPQAMPTRPRWPGSLQRPAALTQRFLKQITLCV